MNCSLVNFRTATDGVLLSLLQLGLQMHINIIFSCLLLKFFLLLFQQLQFPLLFGNKSGWEWFNLTHGFEVGHTEFKLLVSFKSFEEVYECWDWVLKQLSHLQKHQIASSVLKLAFVVFGKTFVPVFIVVDKSADHWDELNVGWTFSDVDKVFHVGWIEKIFDCCL